jgi:beta-barrel assembly-enhancing protease
MKKALIVILVAAVVAVALASVNAKPSLPNIPGIDPKTIKNLQQGINTATGMNEANQAWSFKEERATGRVLAARVAASFGGINKNPAWNEYVNKIGRGLALVSNRPDIKYRFAILNTNDVNAYSCPGGYIFVTKGLLKSVKSEAQLAGVLAHEIAHVSQKHIEKEVRKSKVMGVALDSGLSFAASEGQLKADQVDQIKKLGDAGYDILVKKGYAREDEFEADQLAVKTMVRMGYSPVEFQAFVAGLASDKSGSVQALLSTHPASADRAKAIEEMKNKKWDGLAVLAERLDAVRKANPL